MTIVTNLHRVHRHRQGGVTLAEPDLITIDCIVEVSFAHILDDISRIAAIKINTSPINITFSAV